MKKFYFLTLFVLFVTLMSCSSSDSDDAGDGDDGTNATALEYATFGEALSNVTPDGLKVGGAAVESISALMKTLTGDCATDYTDCPYVTAEGGGDSDTGEILMRLWSLDYDDECTDALLEAETCFDCTDCITGEVGTTYFIIPTMFEDPTTCGTISSTEANYTNGGVDPCFYDASIAQISNIAECETVEGGAVDISAVMPWYASWDLPQTVNFSSYYAQSDGGMWWTVNSGESGSDQCFLSLNSDWLYLGFKDATNDTFMFLASPSPAYNDGMGETGGANINIAAYYGPLSTITKTFEIIQIRDQSYTYIERIKANETHVWYQNWADSEGDVPMTPDEVDAVKDAPTNNRCLEIGESVALSRYVPFDDCVTAFEKTDVGDLNLDSNYTLKIVDIETAAGTDFSAALTDTAETSCLEEAAE